MFKSIKVVGAVAVAAFFCIGCGGDDGGDDNGGGGTKAPYTITFYPDGGTVSPTSAKTGDDGKLDSLPTPTRTGYTFDGWYMKGKAVTVNTVFTANTTIIAEWTAAVTPPTVTTFVDSRDGKTYKKVTIGTETWMAENLNYTTGNSTCYDDDTLNCATYGRLYTWEAAKNACPAGWSLPSDAEWTRLADYVGSNAGTKLKSSTGWNRYSGVPAGSDEYGFSALPGGRRRGTIDANYSDVGNVGIWWTGSSYQNAAELAWANDISSGNQTVSHYHYIKTGYFFSVRCVED
jgi:uncharacterized protein (TIGR02145 family)/uncharacterized repeat protein (TIGR02543 family)